jgi:tetratricopeptide (TPR) repeat protein
MKREIQRLRKFTSGITAVLLLFLLVAAPLPAGAEGRMITATGEYAMSDGETPSVAKERALVNAVRAAAEQAAIYVESYCKTNNLAVTKDEVSALSRGVVKVITKRYDEPKVIKGGLFFRVTITAECDSDDIDSLRNGMKDKEIAMLMKSLQANYDESQRELDALKKQLAKAQGTEVQTIKLRIAQNEQNFTANQWFAQGRDLARQKAYDEAIGSFTEAILLNTLNSNFYYHRSLSYFFSYQYEQAIADLDKVISIRPNYSQAYYQRGCAYMASGKYTLALADFDKAIEFDPQNISAYFARGGLYGAFLNQREKANADYEKVIAVTPQSETEYILHGDTYQGLRQYENAIRDYSQALAINPRNVKTYCSRGDAYIALKQYDRAFSDYDKALAIDPKYTKAYNARGNAYFKLGQYERAIAEFDHVIAINPQNEMAYFYEGFAFSYLKRNQDAIDAFRKYISYSHDQYWISKCKDYIRNLGGTP